MRGLIYAMLDLTMRYVRDLYLETDNPLLIKVYIQLSKAINYINIMKHEHKKNRKSN